jgi:hypothetical protein
MKKFLALSVLLASFGVTAVVAQPVTQVAYAQPQGWHGVMSVDDQSQFDRYYANWVNATRANDRDAISDNARKMQDLMTRYNIPTSVSFDQIASSAPYPAPAVAAYPAGTWQARLSADDQREFDKQYKKWVDSTRKGDQDDISSSARKMQDIMARYSIPSSVPFAEIASGGTGTVVPAPYPNPAYVYPASAAQRLSSDDQHAFDKAYKKWVEARRKHHEAEQDENARKMQDIMTRYNIPANVQFDQIASPDAAIH